LAKVGNGIADKDGGGVRRPFCSGATRSEMAEVRRSQRLLVSVRIQVRSEGPEKERPWEETHTLVVNAHGALIQLNMMVISSQRLVVKNVKTGEEQLCQVASIATNENGKTEVGIEFVEPSPKFWRVAFPPLDWSPHSPEARGFRVDAAGKPPAKSPSEKPAPMPARKP
jgi:hypothetical protein